MKEKKQKTAIRMQVEADSDLEKLNRTFDPLSREKEANLEVRNHNLSSDSIEETDSELRKLIQSSDLLARTKKERRRESETDSELQNCNRSSDQQEMKDSDSVSEDLVRMAIKIQTERREEREKKMNREKGMEVKRNLPNGMMAISSSPVRVLSNADQIVDRKLGLGFDEGCGSRRRFRSKNVEPEPVAVVKKFPRVLGRRRRICYRCGESKKVNCIRKCCKTCMTMGAEDSGFEEIINGQNKFSRTSYTHYFICQLLPLLKQFSWEQICELEIEANKQGSRLSGVQLQVVEGSHDEQLKWYTL